MRTIKGFYSDPYGDLYGRLLRMDGGDVVRVPGTRGRLTIHLMPLHGASSKLDYFLRLRGEYYGQCAQADTMTRKALRVAKEYFS